LPCTRRLTVESRGCRQAGFVHCGCPSSGTRTVASGPTLMPACAQREARAVTCSRRPLATQTRTWAPLRATRTGSAFDGVRLLAPFSGPRSELSADSA
jgi:hypothetical protein